MLVQRSVARPRIGLALGSGSARGWAHIGIIDTLLEVGIEPDIVCGTSIGGRLPKWPARSLARIADSIGRDAGRGADSRRETSDSQ